MIDFKDAKWENYLLKDELSLWQRFCLWFQPMQKAKDNFEVILFKVWNGRRVVYEMITVPPIHWNCRHNIIDDDK